MDLRNCCSIHLSYGGIRVYASVGPDLLAPCANRVLKANAPMTVRTWP